MSMKDKIHDMRPLDWVQWICVGVGAVAALIGAFVGTAIKNRDIKESVANYLKGN